MDVEDTEGIRANSPPRGRDTEDTERVVGRHGRKGWNRRTGWNGRKGWNRRREGSAGGLNGGLAPHKWWTLVQWAKRGGRPPAASIVIAATVAARYAGGSCFQKTRPGHGELVTARITP
jgi:hypothetical protein